MTGSVAPTATIAFLGPSGTFTEEALRSEPGLAHARLVPLPSFVHVLSAVTDGTADYGFVALENSIEGTVSITLDQLVFERDLIIVGEAVLPVTQNLLAPSGARMGDLKRIVSFPHATGQCRAWLTANLPNVEEVAARSTAEAVRLVAESGETTTAAIGTTLAGELYGLGVLAERIEDHAGNSTRFVLRRAPRCGHPGGDGTRQDERGLFPIERPPRQPARDPGPVLGSRPQPGQAGVPPDQAGARRVLLHHRF